MDRRPFRGASCAKHLSRDVKDEEDGALRIAAKLTIYWPSKIARTAEHRGSTTGWRRDGHMRVVIETSNGAALPEARSGFGVTLAQAHGLKGGADAGGMARLDKLVSAQRTQSLLKMLADHRLMDEDASGP